MLLCGAWNSPVVVDSLGKPGSETVLFVWGLGWPGGWGKPGGKRGRCCLFQSAEISLKEVWDLSQPQRLAEGTSVREVDCRRISIKEEQRAQRRYKWYQASEGAQ